MAGEKKKTAGPSSSVKSYLVAYNFIQTLGWSYVLYLLITYYLAPPSNVSLYDTVKWPLAIFQNAAVLEVVHAALRLVSSNPVITGFQVASRVVVVCGVLMITEQAQQTVGLPLALFAWCVTEVIRYAYYTFGLVGEVPYFLSWLRYSLFVFLYPMGVTGELLCIYAAQDEISRTKLLTIELPNALNFTFHYRYILWGVMSLYIPLFPRLYLHMFAQRIRVLGKTNKNKGQ